MTGNSVDIQLLTMCLVQENDKVLLIKRTDDNGSIDYTGVGGEVGFPESLTEGVKRKVREDTGLTVENLVYKGLDEYLNSASNSRYMVFNYLVTSFEGELLEDSPEGELTWVSIDEALELPMQPWVKDRFSLFFEEGTFEIHKQWSGEEDEKVKESVTKL